MNQQTVNVYQVATVKLDSHEGKCLNMAVERVLREVWLQVVKYMAQKAVTGVLWAQIR